VVTSPAAIFSVLPDSGPVTWEEIHGDMARLVSKWMDENGLVSENDYGVRFLSTSAPEALARLSAAAEVIDAD